MKPNLIKQLAELETMPLADLNRKWTELFMTDPPGYNRAFLVKRLAYRIQELAYGGLGEDAQTRLNLALDAGGYDELGRANARPKAKPPAEGIVPGTLLVRDYQGERYTVTVIAGGYEFQGKPYKSLSPIAMEITGTRWNGPAFFGLRGAGKTTVTRRADDGR